MTPGAVALAEWQMLTPRHRPVPGLRAQLTFAVKWEGIDLAVLAQLFQAVEPGAIADTVRATPTGSFARRIWFLYEWLTGALLDLPDAGKIRLTGAADPGQQFALARGEASPRHKAVDTLPGTPRFCPMVRRSPASCSQNRAISRSMPCTAIREASGHVRSITPARLPLSTSARFTQRQRICVTE